MNSKINGPRIDRMGRHHWERSAAACLAVCVAFYLVTCVCDCGNLPDYRSHAAAQEPGPDLETVLVLAQAMLADGGWNAEGEFADHEAIAHALLAQSKRRGVPLREQALAYVAAFDPRSRSPRARWVVELRLEPAAPAHWPAGVVWGSHARHWSAIIGKALAFLVDPARTPNPCPGAYHFGTGTGRDAARAARAGWPRVTCNARVRGAFYSLETAGQP